MCHESCDSTTVGSRQYLCSVVLVEVNTHGEGEAFDSADMYSLAQARLT